MEYWCEVKNSNSVTQINEVSQFVQVPFFNISGVTGKFVSATLEIRIQRPKKHKVVGLFPEVPLIFPKYF